MDWSDLRHILAVGRDGTLAAAARRLGVDQTTVARRLRAAERALGRALFERLDGALRPTEAGAAAIAQAAKVEALVASLVDDPAGTGGPAGLVRVTGVPVLINRLLVPALARFRQTAPHIRLELLAEPRNLSLSRREADIALRLSRPQHDAAALTKRIGRLDYAVYGPAGMTSGDLPWVGYGEGLAHLPQARWIATAAGAASGLTVGDAETIVAALHAGLGRSLLPCLVADPDTRLARLSGQPVLSREIWLLTPRETRHEPRIDAVITWLEHQFSRSC